METSVPRAHIQAKHYETLLRLTGEFSSKLPDQLAHSLAEKLRDVLNFDFLDVLVCKSGSDEMVWQSTVSGQFPLSGLSIEQTAAWWAFNKREQLIIQDWDEDNRFCDFKSAVEQRGIRARSLCILPLITHHRAVGVLGLMSSTPHAFTEDARQFLALLADTIALAIDNSLSKEETSRARADLEQQNARLKLLLDLTSQVTSNLELRELLRAASSCIRQVMKCDGVVVTLPMEGGAFQMKAYDFPASKGAVRDDLVVSSSVGAAQALRTLRPVIADPSQSDQYPPVVLDLIRREGVKAVCYVPLVSRARAVGMLILLRVEDRHFTQEDADFLGQMAGQIAIAVENALAFRDISDLKDRLAQEKLYLEQEIRTELNFEQVIGTSASLKKVLELVDTVAPSDSTVLLLGETGTGKELIARAIHEHSRRKGRTFVKLNCAAIPTGLLESELFGHEKGAFTGAISQRIGRLELADQGTLFLDEVGDVPTEIQPKLLRVLQEREFERLGSAHTKKVNVRLIAATNRNLEQMIAAHEFRSDLFYRLNVFPIHIPPLRERREDIPLLIRYFVQKYAREMQKPIDTVPSTVLKHLQNLDWPGNIRELENFIERAVILTSGKTLVIPLTGLGTPSPAAPKEAVAASPSEEIARIVRETISELEKHDSPGRIAKEFEERQKREIISALEATNGRVGGPDGAAARMGIKRTTLISRMEKYGLSSKQFSR